MWSPDAEREPVPVISDAERPLSDARRQPRNLPAGSFLYAGAVTHRRPKHRVPMVAAKTKNGIQPFDGDTGDDNSGQDLILRDVQESSVAIVSNALGEPRRGHRGRQRRNSLGQLQLCG